MAGISTVTGEVKYVREGGGKTTVVPSGSTSSTQSSSTPSDAKKSTDTSVKKQVNSKIEEYISGSMTVLPNSDFRPSQVYKVMGLGNVFSGKYYVNRVVHTISDTYTVQCEVMQVEALADTTLTPDVIRQRALQLPVGGK